MPEPKTDRYVLAVDHGTSGMKTALVSVRGELIDFEYQPTQTYFGPHGAAEQDPEAWWRALIATAKKLVAKRIIPPEKIVAVGCSSTFSSTVAVDETGRHLTNSLTWLDSRGAPYVREVVSGFPSVQGYSLFTMLPWIYKTAGGPQLSGKDDVAHVLLWKREFPEIYQRARYFLGSKDYLNLRLTGQAAASFDSIMLFWVTNTRDVNRVRYDDGLIKKLGIDKAKLPPLRQSAEILGALRPEVADEIGLSREVQVSVGSPDHQSACIGSGAVRDFEGHIYIGTSSWVQCIVPFKKTDMFHSIASLPTAIPGKYYSVNEQDIAGGVLPFLVEKFLFPQNQLHPGPPPELVYERLDEIAATAPAGSNRLLVTPWLNGERTPVDDPSLRAGIYNLSLTTTSADVVRAFFEGVAFNTRWAFQYVEKFVGRRLDPLNMIGGGAKSAIWCQIFADVLDRTIRQVQDPMQANARGAAFIAAVALGDITFADVPDLVPITNTFTPNPLHRKLYDELFAEFLQIYKNNSAMFRRLNRDARKEE